MVIETPETFFPELEGDERENADEWLYDYLRLVIRIHREHVEAHSEQLSTLGPLTEPEVLAGSVRPLSRPSPTSDENPSE